MAGTTDTKSGQRRPLVPVDGNHVIVIPDDQPSKKPTKAPQAKSTKRKAPGPEELPEIDSDDERLNYITDNCDQVRRKINNFINCGEMKIGEFQRAIGVTGNSYRTFLGQSGKGAGAGSNTYIGAARFFKKRELQGLKPPKKTVKKAKAGEKSKFDVSSIHLEGESDDDVPVYDTCDVVRKKLRAILRDPEITQAGLLREISKACGNGRQFQSASLNAFLSKTGPMAGNRSDIFYASYVFFEKLRIRDGKPKTEFREDMEEVWDGCMNYARDFKPGFDRKTTSSTGYFVSRGMTPYMDEYGRVRTYRR